MVGMLRRLSGKVSRVFKKPDNEDPSTLSLDPLLVVDEGAESDSLYSGPPRTSFVDSLRTKRDVPQEPGRRETWAPGVTPGSIPRPPSEDRPTSNEDAANSGAMFSGHRISRGGFGGSRYPGLIKRRPVPSSATQSATWSHSTTHHEAQLASDEQIATELQRQAWEEEEEVEARGGEMDSSHGTTNTTTQRHTGHDRNEFPASSDSSGNTVPGTWQEYDQAMWDSASNTASNSTSSSPPQAIPAGYWTNRFWTGWVGSSWLPAATPCTEIHTGTRQPENHVKPPTPTEDAPTERRKNPFRRKEVPSQPQECVVCFDVKNQNRFPTQALTSHCDHPPRTCLDCLESHISATVNTQAFTPDMIKCPECLYPLSVQAVQQYATPPIAELFLTRASDNLIDQIPNLFRCPAPHCGSAQIHDSPEGGANDSPIVRCVKCSGKFCFHHSVVWHETLTCAEYDAFLANPRGFRSAFERDNERVEREREVQDRRRREQEERDAEYAQSLMEEEQREDAKRKAEAEKKARREQEERARKKKEEELRLQREKRRKMEEEAERKRIQEAANLKTIEATTKRCPNSKCGWPIEKNDGCAHMTCTRCSHQFCYDCLASYKRIQKGDNSAHERSCPWHTDNIGD